MSEIKPRRPKAKILTTRLFFNAEPFLKDEAYAAADSLGINFSQYVRDLIVEDLEKRGVAASKTKRAA